MKNECKCKQGFYLESNKCRKCHWSCFDCIDSSETSCISCISNLKINSDNLCLCSIDYYLFNLTCKLCNPTLNFVLEKDNVNVSKDFILKTKSVKNVTGLV